MSPVRCTCVPPHSSVENSPIPITRTSSPYFSPNNAMAPALMASSYFIRRGFHRAVAANLRVDQPLHLADLLGGEWLVVREVEARLPGIDQRALLLHVAAQHLAQRRVHQVRGGVVVGRSRRATRRSTCALTMSLTVSRPVLQHTVVAEHLGLDLLRVLHFEHSVAGDQLSRVANLAARLGVEGRAVEHDDRLLARLDRS